MRRLPTLAQSKVTVQVDGTRGPFVTRILGQRGRRLLLSVPVGKAPSGAWAKAGTKIEIRFHIPEDAQRALEGVVLERRLKPIPLLLVEVAGDLPLAAVTPASPDTVGEGTLIAVTSGKGGTGKTTFATNFAWYLASQGYRTLLIDADIGSANCHLHFNLFPESDVGALLTGRSSWEQVVIPVTSSLSLIAGISGSHGEVDPTPWMFSRLVAAIEELRSRWDVILLDTGAGVHASVTNLLLTSPYVALVTGNDPASYLGAYSLLSRINQEGVAREVGLVVNRSENVADAAEASGAFLASADAATGMHIFRAGIIPDDPYVLTSLNQGRPLVALVPRSPAAIAYRQAFESILGRFIAPGRRAGALSPLDVS